MSQSPNPAALQQVAPLLALATTLLMAGRPADAIAPLRDAALLQPSNPMIQHDLGLACLEVGRVPDAIAALQRAVASNPRYGDAYFRLGIALEKRGDIGEAIAAYDRATQLLPTLTEAWFRAGALVYQLGDRDQAIGCFNRAAATGGKTSLGRLAKATEAITSGHRRTAETANRLFATTQCVKQSAATEPRLSQRWEQFRGALIRSDRLVDIAQLLQGDSQAEICIAVARVAGDGALECRDGIRYTADL